MGTAKALLGLGPVVVVLALVSSALAFSSVSVPAVTSSVDVADPTFDVDANLKNHVSEIPADGQYRRVDDISVIAHDPNYDYTVTTIEVVSNGAFLVATCGTWDYRLSNGSDLATGINFTFPADSANHDTGFDLQLMIPSAGTNATCRIFGGIIEVTFDIV